MPRHFVADLHLHSRYARATSRELNPENLHRWAALKGIDVVGTGDFTHPVWLAELKEKLEPAEEGLYRLQARWREPVDRELPNSCRREVRFLLSTEISTIYKKKGRTRKVHSLILVPDLAAAEALNRRLAALGNLEADGRPILGLDSRQLLELCLEVCPQVLFIPAHIWTPHFSVLGASSGFDSLEECFEELLPQIPAVETGLSSDPPMNWRLSALDRLAIVSNSDAHSPQKLGREATCFAAEFSYPGIYRALSDPGAGQLAGTLEFYPQEGKYHCDGHRQCQVCWYPSQTLAAGGRCPQCGRPLTVGVLHRVEELADRPEGVRPITRPPFEYLIPLDEVIGSAIAAGPGSGKVQALYGKLLAALGPELHILRAVEVEAIARCGEVLVAEGVRRMRAGEVEIRPGYDGEYGRIQVFAEGERERFKGQTALFALPAAIPAKREAQPAGERRVEAEAVLLSAPPASAEGLDPDQRRVVEAEGGPLIVIAGPGSGKTRVLTWRIAHLVRERGVRPEQIAAVTFTNRAAGELRERLQQLLSEVPGLEALRVGTFHRLALDLLRLGGAEEKEVIGEWEARQVLAEALAGRRPAMRLVRLQRLIALAKGAGQRPEEVEEAEVRQAYQAYQERLAVHRMRDYDDLLLDLVALLQEKPEFLAQLRERLPYLLVDEFQDVDALQYRLVHLLAGTGQGLMVIGDPNQAIYGFRGASPHFFAALKQVFPQAQVFYLGTNYRSQGRIAMAAAAVIQGHGSCQPLKAMRPMGLRLRLLRVPGEKAEGIAVVRQISRMVGGADMRQADQQAEGGRTFGDFAVLFRTGSQAEMLEECFQREGLPYRLIGQKEFLERESVHQALTFARYLVDPDSGLRRVHALKLAHFPLTGEALAAAVAQYQGLEPAEFFRRWQEDFGQKGDRDLERLIRLAARASSLRGLIETVLLGREGDWEQSGDSGSPNAEEVRLMTLHAAKGLEFPVVFICGVEEGLIPLREGEGDLEEERRLFYVGMTRAREELVLLCSRSRTRHGQRLHPQVSPFVRDIPSELLLEEEVELPRRGESEQMSLF